jgi:hypothetical protein
MGSQAFASGKKAIAMCDRCGQQFKLRELKSEVVKLRPYKVLVCKSCWDPDHPQLQLGMYPVEDPQALRDSRRDTTYTTSGVLPDGYLGDGSRQFQWGWNPVGGSRAYDDALTPNDLVLSVTVGTVTVVVT